MEATWPPVGADEAFAKPAVIGLGAALQELMRVTARGRKSRAPDVPPSAGRTSAVEASGGDVEFFGTVSRRNRFVRSAIRPRARGPARPSKVSARTSSRQSSVRRCGA